MNWSLSRSATRLFRDGEEFGKFKREERKINPTMHPERRIRIFQSPLLQIIRYRDFRCHPFSSVARNEAVFGADIESALIIVDTEPSKEAQEAFVSELRNQGFRAFTEAAYKAQLEQIRTENTAGSYERSHH